MYQEGRYLVTITGQLFGESKKKQTPYFALEVVPEAYYDPMMNEPVACEKTKRTIMLYMTEGTIEFVCEKLRHLGYEGNSFAELDPETPGHHSFVGVQCDAYCKHEQFTGDDGQTRDQEKWDISIGGGGIQHAKLDDKGKRRLDALFGKALKSTAAKSKAPFPTHMAKKRDPGEGIKPTPATGEAIPF